MSEAKDSSTPPRIVSDDTGPAGHRERLRERFAKGGADAMPDYELLELTLFAALPRRDTKPLAKALLARFGAKVSPLKFGRLAMPGIAVGFTTTTSMAALPTMLDAALNRMGISKAVAGFVLPVGATLNRPGSAIYQMAAVVTVGSLYGVHLGPAQYGAALITSFLMTFSVAAIPSATVFTTAPVLAAAGLPIEALALLIGVDRIPDMFRTGLHCASHQTIAAVVARGEGEEIAA